MIVGSKGALVLVHSGKEVEEREWFGLFVDGEGRLIADVLLDLGRGLEASTGPIASAARSDGSFIVLQGPTFSSERDVRPARIRWLEVSSEHPRACARIHETPVFASTSPKYDWADTAEPKLVFEALVRPDTHEIPVWHELRADGTLSKAAPPSPTVASKKGFELIFGPGGLRRLAGFRPGATLPFPEGLEPIDVSPYVTDVLAVRSPVWTGTHFVAALPVRREGAAVLSINCRPSAKP